MDCGCSRECETQERWGFLLNPELLEGFWQWATLTCQWKSWAGWKCSAGKRPGATVLWHEPVHDSAGRRMSAERSTQQGGLETEMWVARIAYSKWWHLSFYCDPKQMQYWNSWTLAHIQIIGFPWINRCSPFTARTPDCLHKIFLPLSSWNVFTGNNNNSRIIAMKRTGNGNELTKLAMNGIPTPCELNRGLIAQCFLCRKG